MTVTDFGAAGADCNAQVAMSVDVAGFWDLVLGVYDLAAAAMEAG
jgi:inosine-uridine nucleoside N-ribohydrolase